MTTANDLSKGVEFLCRHLVGLCVTYRHTTPDEAPLRSRFTTCSGTLLFVEGALYFLTAGHVLRELHELRQHSDVLIEGASLADVFGYQRISDTPIPFDIRDAQLAFIDDDKLGLDFGIIPIGPHHARLLAKNKVVAFSEETWIKQRDVKFDGYVMLGFPSERVSERVSAASTVTIEPTAFSVRRLNIDSDRQTKYPRFVGHVDARLSLESLVGMSGGPIFGFRTEPRLSYWMVAIQSSWNATTRTIYGCDFPMLASLMTSWARNSVPVLRDLGGNSALICPHADR
jgi:hypothetical protein